MDLSVFCNKSYSSKQWINEILTKNISSINNESFLQSLLVELQHQVEEVNSIIQDNCQKLSGNLPNVVNEIEILNGNISNFSERLYHLKHEIEAIDKNTDDSVTKLEKIDNLKLTLENAKQALHEADNWSILVSKIEKFFDNGNIEKITSILLSLQQSLYVLSNAEDYEDKKMQLEGLKNRLEASVSPHIVKAFTTYNLEESLKYMKIFKEIERVPQLLTYYIKCQKCSMCQYWKSLIDSEQDMNLTEQLRSLYDMLLLNWQKQIRWCNEVFATENMIHMMIELYSETLNDLDPSLTSCMDVSLKQHSQPLLLLLEYHQILNQFQVNLESLYVFNNDSGKTPDWKPVLKSLYYPFTQYVSKYGTLERQLLDHYLWVCFSKVDLQTDIIDYIRNVGLTIPIVINIAKEAENRCIMFTHGCTLDGFIVALKGFFLKYVDKYKDVGEKLSKESDGVENWQVLTSCLSFQQVIGELLSEIKTYESHLKQLIVSKKNDEDLKIYASFILTNAARENFTKWLELGPNDPSSSLSNVISALENVVLAVHNISYKVSFMPIRDHLSSSEEIWHKLNSEGRDLPDYSYSPLEYITQIGEHLITLPQHLEPFLSQENISLNSILEIINKNADNVVIEKETYANVLLMAVARGACNVYSDQILNIRELNTSAVRQLIADINYLSNVLEELGIGLTEDLQHILQLLRLSPEEYQTKVGGFSPKLVAAIRQIRKLLST